MSPAERAPRCWPTRWRRGSRHGRATPVADVERIEPGACAEVDLRTLAISYRRWYAAADAVDPEVVGLGLNLPLEERVGRERKSLLRAVGARHLPAEIVARRKQVGLRSYAKRWTERGARPEFLEEGRLRDVLGVPAEPWRAFVRGLSGNAVIRAVTGEIWCRLMLEGNPAGTVESELWR